MGNGKNEYHCRIVLLVVLVVIFVITNIIIIDIGCYKEGEVKDEMMLNDDISVDFNNCKFVPNAKK